MATPKSVFRTTVEEYIDNLDCQGDIRDLTQKKSDEFTQKYTKPDYFWAIPFHDIFGGSEVWAYRKFEDEIMEILMAEKVETYVPMPEAFHIGEIMAWRCLRAVYLVTLGISTQRALTRKVVADGVAGVTA